MFSIPSEYMKEKEIQIPSEEPILIVSAHKSINTDIVQFDLHEKVDLTRNLPDIWKLEQRPIWEPIKINDAVEKIVNESKFTIRRRSNAPHVEVEDRQDAKLQSEKKAM